MTHRLSLEDSEFRAAFEGGTLSPSVFDHRAHVRLAYVYLVGQDTGSALARMRAGLLAFLAHHGIPATKYHETLTRAWILAVRHFMDRAGDTPSAEAFIEASPQLLDSRIMLTHYSAGLLFSAEARARFVEPDVRPIPHVDAD